VTGNEDGTSSAGHESRREGPPGTERSETELAAVLNDIPAALGVPFVNLIFHRLAQWPTYLTQVWCRTRPLIETEEFASATRSLQDLVESAMPLEVAVPAEVTAASLSRAVRLSDMYSHVQPQLLLLTAGWAAGLESRTSLPPPMPPAGSGRATKPVFDEDSNVPMAALPPVDPQVAATFTDMVERRRHPGVASYYRSLAHWPALLTTCWRALESVTASPEYFRRARDLSTTATALAGRLGIRDAGAVPTTDTLAVLELLRSWRDVQVPQLMLDTRLLGTALRSAAATRGA
jgi:hypothetical protein